MLSPRFAPLILAAFALATARAAGAQVIVREGVVRQPTLLTRAPVAQVSFTPYKLSALLESKPVGAKLVAVSVSSPGTHVMLARTSGSAIVVSAPQGVADGVYSVAFTFTWVNQPSVVTISKIMTGSPNVLHVQCNLTQQTSYAQGAPVQTCDTGDLSAQDLTSGVVLQVSQGVQMDVSNITVTRWR